MSSNPTSANESNAVCGLGEWVVWDEVGKWFRWCVVWGGG